MTPPRRPLIYNLEDAKVTLDGSNTLQMFAISKFIYPLKKNASKYSLGLLSGTTGNYCLSSQRSFVVQMHSYFFTKPAI
jgi:hypothetical protein